MEVYTFGGHAGVAVNRAKYGRTKLLLGRGGGVIRHLFPQSNENKMMCAQARIFSYFHIQMHVIYNNHK